jgi:hypothetical protein
MLARPQRSHRGNDRGGLFRGDVTVMKRGGEVAIVQDDLAMFCN